MYFKRSAASAGYGQPGNSHSVSPGHQFYIVVLAGPGWAGWKVRRAGGVGENEGCYLVTSSPLPASPHTHTSCSTAPPRTWV
ncbi:hypothetical protein BaRGS_00013422 [Batillaria attramentaria]|uniref:Uncharacterized protein n=1 Tax=Batillaria attramentaria TaxID=370345 RepID=A0ABD0L7M9_9CAEN